MLSPGSYNRRVGLALFCPVTSRVKSYPFEARIPPGLAVKGAVLADRLKSLDWRERVAGFAEALPNGIADEIVEKIDLILRP